MRMIVPLAAGLVLLAPATGLAQQQEDAAREPVVGLSQYPVPAPARAVYEGDVADAEPDGEAYEEFENEGEWDYSEDEEEFGNEGEGDYSEEGVDLGGYGYDLDLVDVIEQRGELATTNATAKPRFFYRELPNGEYEWALVEQRTLPGGEVDTIVLSNDAENGFEEIHIVEEARGHSIFGRDEEMLREKTLE